MPLDLFPEDPPKSGAGYTWLHYDIKSATRQEIVDQKVKIGFVDEALKAESSTILTSHKTPKPAAQMLAQIREWRKHEFNLRDWRTTVCEEFDPLRMIGLNNQIKTRWFERFGPRCYENLSAALFREVWNKPLRFADIPEVVYTPGAAPLGDEKNGSLELTFGYMLHDHLDLSPKPSKRKAWMCWPEMVAHPEDVQAFLRTEVGPIYLFSDRETIFTDENDELAYAMEFCRL